MHILPMINSRLRCFHDERNQKNNSTFKRLIDKELILEGQDECYRNVNRLLTSVCDYSENTLDTFSMKCKVGVGVHIGSQINVEANGPAIDVNIMLCNATPDSIDFIKKNAENILLERFSIVKISIDEGLIK